MTKAVHQKVDAQELRATDLLRAYFGNTTIFSAALIYEIGRGLVIAILPQCCGTIATTRIPGALRTVRYGSMVYIYKSSSYQ